MSEELVREILEWAASHVGIVIVIMGVFVQITPIKIYPLNWIKSGLRWLGTAMTQDVSSKIDHLEAKIDTLEQEEDRKWISQIRSEILNFDTKLKRGYDYDREAYEHILDDLHPAYEKLLKKYGMENGKVDRAMRRIQEAYDKMMHTEV